MIDRLPNGRGASCRIVRFASDPGARRLPDRRGSRPPGKTAFKNDTKCAIWKPELPLRWLEQTAMVVGIEALGGVVVTLGS